MSIEHGAKGKASESESNIRQKSPAWNSATRWACPWLLRMICHQVSLRRDFVIGLVDRQKIVVTEQGVHHVSPRQSLRHEFASRFMIG